MDAQETQEAESAADHTGEGNQPEESKEIAKLRKDNERLEAQLTKKKELLAERQNLEAREALGGTSSGPAQPVKPEEDTPKEYAEKVLGGALNKKE